MVLHLKTNFIDRYPAMPGKYYIHTGGRDQTTNLPTPCGTTLRTGPRPKSLKRQLDRLQQRDDSTQDNRIRETLSVLLVLVNSLVLPIGAISIAASSSSSLDHARDPAAKAFSPLRAVIP